MSFKIDSEARGMTKSSAIASFETTSFLRYPYNLYIKAFIYFVTFDNLKMS